MKIAFIGGGNMGEAMLSAILAKGLSTPQSITISDVDESCCQQLRQKHGVAAMSDNRLVAAKGDIVILAIKPQNLAGVMAELDGHLKPSQLVLSIVAGTSIDTLCKGLTHQQIVRAMPNTPAQIGEGVTVWTATSAVTGQKKTWARSILEVMGREIQVDDERYIDMATAVSGSGPAYFFLFMEALAAAAEDIGLPTAVAQELVLQTAIGSARLVRETEKPSAELRRMVTSPGGTTEEALRQLEKDGFRELILKAVIAAYEKARSLGTGNTAADS